MSFLIAFLISIKIKMNKDTKSIIFRTSKNCKFWSDNSIKPLSIKVKNVKKPINNVIINNKIRYMFFLIKSDI
jgi:hypothetical protein